MESQEGAGSKFIVSLPLGSSTIFENDGSAGVSVSGSMA